MKNLLLAFCCFSVHGILVSQSEKSSSTAVEAAFFYGNIIEHNPAIQHLITAHPTGFLIALNKKTYGHEEWERRYNYPDWGFSASYQNMHNSDLGLLFGIYGHINWYFLNRNLRLQVGQGVAYATDPYDTQTNYNNIAYGSHLLSSTYLKGNFIRENIYKGLGAYAGIILVHYSNGNYHTPNKSTNTLGINAGVTYHLDYKDPPEHIIKKDSLSSTHAQRIAYNLALRAGLNESDVIGLGQKPFYEISVFADKRLNYKSSLQVGVDFFFSHFLKEYIKFRSIAYPEGSLRGDEDYKRIGVFVGHELRFNKVAAITQLGYYLYWPSQYENRVYSRLGLKRYMFSDKYFATISVHSHWAKAEAVEFGIGYRFK